jgi:hypothetical protein
VKAKEEAHAIKVEQKRLEYMDDEQHDRYMREMFYNEERTEHKGVLPARERIKQYKTKSIRRNITTAVGSKSVVTKKGGNLSQSLNTLQIVPEDGKVKFDDRPITAGVGSMQSEA